MSENISRVLKWVLLIIAVPALLYLGKTFLAPLAIGTVLTLMLIPVANWLENKGLSPGFAVLGSTLLLLFFFIFLGSLLAIQIKLIASDWPEIEKTMLKLLDDAQVFIQQKAGVDPDEQLKQAKQLLSNLGKTGPAALGTIIGTLTSFVLVIVYVVLLLSQRKRFKKFILMHVAPEKRLQALDALTEIRKTSGGYFWGMFKAMLILAVLYGAGFLIGGVKYALLLALIAAACSFVPYVGNVIGGGLAAILAMVSGGFSSVLVVFGVMFAAQMIDNYITQPYVVGKEVDLNPFVTITSVIAFGILWGVPGAIIAIPITGILRVIFKYLDQGKPFAFVLGNDKPDSVDLNT